MSCPLAHETLALAMRAAGIFFLECRDSNHRTNMAVTAVDGYESTQESECINPVGFHPTCPPIDGLTWRLAGSSTRHSMPTLVNKRASQKPSYPAS